MVKEIKTERKINKVKGRWTPN